MRCSDKMLGELVTSRMALQRENAQLKADNEWLRKVLAIALERCPALVIRKDVLDTAPELEQTENLADELVISIKKERSRCNGNVPFDDLML